MIVGDSSVFYVCSVFYSRVFDCSALFIARSFNVRLWAFDSLIFALFHFSALLIVSEVTVQNPMAGLTGASPLPHLRLTFRCSRQLRTSPASFLLSRPLTNPDSPSTAHFSASHPESICRQGICPEGWQTSLW
jgi:hypothetical protein